MSQIATLSNDGQKVKTRSDHSFWAELYRNLKRNRSAKAGAAILGFLVLVAIFASLIAPYSPTDPLLGKEPNLKVRKPPCIVLAGCPDTNHWMGIDLNGR